MINNQNLYNKETDKEKLEILERALSAPIDITYLKAGKTKYKYQTPTLGLVLGMSGTGKTSYLLSLFMDAPYPEKQKALIYINNSLFPLDKIVVEYAKKHKNVLIITRETFDIMLAKYIIELVKGYNNDPKKPVYTYVVIDNMVFDIDPNTLKMFIGTRHYNILVFILIHVVSNPNATALCGLRDLSTHYIVFKWFDTEKLKKILSMEDRADFISKINDGTNKYAKMIFDKCGQTKYVE